MERSPVREKSYAFALGVIRLHRTLVGAREYVLARQVLRSGTSIGANVEEAVAAESRRDFASKMSVASKEARECHYWLRLLRDSELGPARDVRDLLDQCDQLIRMLSSIVKTTKQSQIPTPRPPQT